MLSGLTDDAGFEQQEAAAGLYYRAPLVLAVDAAGRDRGVLHFNKHLSGVWDIDAYLHHRGRHQELVLTGFESAHDLDFLIALHAPVQ